MKELKCEILPRSGYYSHLAGQTVTVRKVKRDCSQTSGFTVHAELEDGEQFSFYGSELKPLDVSDVPKAHVGSLMLQQVWVFGQARDDAWHRSPPLDLKSYEKEHGKPWKDKRTWAVAKARA